MENGTTPATTDRRGPARALLLTTSLLLLLESGCRSRIVDPLELGRLKLTPNQVGLIVWNQYKHYYAGYYEYKITFDAPEPGCRWSVPTDTDYASHTGPAPQTFPWPKQCKRTYVQVEIRIRPSAGRAEDFTNYQQMAVRGQFLTSQVVEHTD